MPRDVDLERGIDVLGQDVLIPRQVHQLVIVPEDRRGRRLEIATSNAHFLVSTTDFICHSSRYNPNGR